MPNTMDRLFGIHEQSMLLRSQRTTILASNLANVDTPNYKARDIDFKSVLETQQSTSSMRINRTNNRHLSQPGSVSHASLQYRVPLQSSLDGNTVDNHIEQGKFTDNAIHYQASLQFLSGRINGMIRALKGE